MADTGLLDTSKSGETAWLVKVPIAIAKAWRAACAAPVGLEDKPDDTLGTLICMQNGQEQMSFIDLAALKAQEGFPLPKRVKLQPVLQAPGDNSKTCVFSYQSADGSNGKTVNSARVDGSISQRLDLVPVTQTVNGEWVVDEGYRALVNKRSLQAAEKTRTVQSHEDNQEANIAAISRQRIVNAQLGLKRKAVLAGQKATEVKRSKMEVSELEALLFRLFERQTAWPLKQLQAETAQPIQHLREVLDTIAVQQRRGPNKDKYELKAEYRSRKSGQLTIGVAPEHAEVKPSLGL